MPCSLRSQLQRMFVPESAFGLVSEDDLVVTSDVDTFVMRPDIFEELLEPQNLDKISTRMLVQMFYDLNISPRHTFLSISLPRWFWALQAKILDNVESNYRKSQDLDHLSKSALPKMYILILREG